MAVRRPTAGAPGQHFLRSSKLAEAFVREAGVRPGDLVVEIGGGTGAITRPLLRAGATVVVLERDPVLATALRRLEPIRRLTVEEADACRWTWPRSSFAVVANLPFRASGEILAHLLGDPRVPLRRADVIVQWEFAVKQAAVWPATLKSTYWRAWHEVTIERRLSRTSFTPVPSVDAAVLRIVRRAEPLVAPDQHRAYKRFLDDAFAASSRLGPTLSSMAVKRLSPVHGFAPGARPRDLDARQWAALFAQAGARGERLR